MMQLAQCARWCNASLYGPAFAVDAVINGVATDSRQIKAGELFVALIGERYNAMEFLADAMQAGAAAVLINAPRADIALPQLVVSNTQKALGELAKAYLQTMPAKRIALTGSNGKTTVKNLTASILSQCGVTVATRGNLNNEIGVPITALSVRSSDQFAVLEMGAGQVGDIAYLADIGRPQVAAVNNAMAAHLERLHSVIGVAKEKASIYQGLTDDGIAVINTLDLHAAIFFEAARGHRCLTIGADQKSDFYASDIKLGADTQFVLHTPAGSAPVRLALLGMHNVQNATMAAALSFAAGASLAQICLGLEQTHAVSGRLQIQAQPGGWQLLDDSYNANPGSVKAGIAALAALQASAAAEGWLVLGNMAELGEDELQLHADIGAFAKNQGLARVLTLGEKAAHAAHAAGSIGTAFSDIDSMIAVIRRDLRSGVHLLVKGSRSSKMERVVQALTGASLVQSNPLQANANKDAH
jgi:UDP-N-acetylmuramoyl-tripeptide--D-alanyl-D-alanine ligase